MVRSETSFHSGILDIEPLSKNFQAHFCYEQPMQTTEVGKELSSGPGQMPVSGLYRTLLSLAASCSGSDISPKVFAGNSIPHVAPCWEARPVGAPYPYAVNTDDTRTRVS